MATHGTEALVCAAPARAPLAKPCSSAARGSASPSRELRDDTDSLKFKPEPISLFVGFQDEICSVGFTIKTCHADARTRGLKEHAAYASDSGANLNVERLEG